MFDVARNLLLAEVDGGKVTCRENCALRNRNPAERAEELAALNVDVVICGAVSHPLMRMMSASNLRVIPNICGPVEEILDAFLQNRLSECSFQMPGVHGLQYRRVNRNRGRWNW